MLVMRYLVYVPELMCIAHVIIPLKSEIKRLVAFVVISVLLFTVGGIFASTVSDGTLQL